MCASEVGYSFDSHIIVSEIRLYFYFLVNSDNVLCLGRKQTKKIGAGGFYRKFFVNGLILAKEKTFVNGRKKKKYFSFWF